LAGVPFTPGEVCIFDGLMYAQSRVRDWHDARVAEGAAGEAARAAERSSSATATAAASDDEEVEPAPRGPDAAAAALARLTLSAAPDRPLPTITSSPAIVDRKSAFVGHAARITDAHDVAAVVAHLLTDRKIARAAHPTIWAFRAVRDVGGAAGKVVESGEWSNGMGGRQGGKA
jgi:hypothetical protein